MALAISTMVKHDDRFREMGHTLYVFPQCGESGVTVGSNDTM